MSGFELVALKEGGWSLRPHGGGETFHPVVGPMVEARTLHVEQQRLTERARSFNPFVIWDVGLGAAANALAAVEALRGHPCRVELHSFDLSSEALAFAGSHAKQLAYPAPYIDSLSVLLEKGSTQIGAVQWFFHEGDFYQRLRTDSLPAPHALLYDPYSPETNPGMWTLERLSLLRQQLAEPCLLSNYTRSTAVRVTLLLAGFYVGYGAGVGEKDQTTVASNDVALLEKPLPKEWLKRVCASTNAAPLREAQKGRSPIGPGDWEQLCKHLQFS